MKKVGGRDIGIDLIRVFAILGVLIIHTCSYDASVGSFNWYSSLFWGSISRGAVPLFLMVSGAMMLSKDYTIKKLFTKNILRILVALFFWAIIYKIFHLCMDNNFTIDNFIYGIKEVIVFKHEFHFYYLHMLLIVYLCLPITRIIVKNATKKQLQYVLGLWFFLAIFMPSVMPYKPFSIMPISGMWPISLTYASIGYGILGYYIRKYPISKQISLALIVVGFLVIFLGTTFGSFRYDALYEHFLSGTGFGACALTVGTFGFLNRVDVKNICMQKMIVSISKASFCIYLVHIFFLVVMRRMGIVANMGPYIISIPVLTLINMAVSFAVYGLLSKLPIIRNWII